MSHFFELTHPWSARFWSDRESIAFGFDSLINLGLSHKYDSLKLSSTHRTFYRVGVYVKNVFVTNVSELHVDKKYVNVW
jgi:hypothetical protein